MSLSASRSGESLCLAVVDCGGGLASGKRTGWGVGLELARAALERMGGELEIGTSESGGVNARIILPLPLTAST